MQAQLGDWLRFQMDGQTVRSEVVGISECCNGTEDYETAIGVIINETELGIDDVLLESEV